MKALTVKQQNILNFITEFDNTEGMAPTVYELADHFGTKSTTIFAHLRALQRKGKISRSSKARSIKLIDNAHGKSAFISDGTIPLENSYGKIGELHVDKKQPELVQYFAFQIPDDAMSDFGIFGDDIVIVSRDQEPKPGDLIVIGIANKSIIRSFYPTSNDNIELRPANKNFQSQICRKTDVIFRGIVTALQRKY